MHRGLEEELMFREVTAMLKDEHTFKRFHAARNQAAVARELGENRRAVDGLGAVKMEVHNDVYHYWGQKLGYKCWSDKGFQRWIQNHYPETRVKCAGTRAQSGWSPKSQVSSPRSFDGGIEFTGGKRFVKTYANG